MNYAVEQRLRLIDILLDKQGFINRSVLMDYFGISMPQASKDINAYIKLAPNNMLYDKSKKTYLKSQDFKRLGE